MWWVTIITSLIAAGGLITVAIIQRNGNKEKENERAETEAYRKRREQAEKKQIEETERLRQADIKMQEARDKVLVAAGNLSLVTSVAVSGGVINGNVEKAQTKYTEALDAFDAVQGNLAREYLHIPK